MLKEVIAIGDTVEEAIDAAKKELNVEDDFDVNVEVLETPTKKTFGLFGGNPAKVRVYFEDAPETFSFDDPAEQASAYLKTILAGMGLNEIEIDINENEAGALLVLKGGDVGYIIGHRGETLDSLQYLASLVANHVEDKYFRITLDVGNYREKRKDTLETLGKKMAFKSLKSGRNNHLEPMNPYERRIIHTAVQDIEGAKSWSEGEDMRRHVVIGPEAGERPRRNYNNNRGGYNNRGNNRGGSNRGGYNKGGYDKPYNKSYNKPYNKPAATSADKPSQPVTKRQDDPAAPVYGKIEAPKAED